REAHGGAALVLAGGGGQPLRRGRLRASATIPRRVPEGAREDTKEGLLGYSGASERAVHPRRRRHAALRPGVAAVIDLDLPVVAELHLGPLDAGRLVHPPHTLLALRDAAERGRVRRRAAGPPGARRAVVERELVAAVTDLLELG